MGKAALSNVAQNSTNSNCVLRLAKYVLKEARKAPKQGLCLAATLVKFFKKTGGVKRKMFLPSRTVAKRQLGAASKSRPTKTQTAVIRPNKDMARFSLSKALTMAGHFLDGHLQGHFASADKKKWVVRDTVLRGRL